LAKSFARRLFEERGSLALVDRWPSVVLELFRFGISFPHQAAQPVWSALTCQRFGRLRPVAAFTFIN
jgi:hypothetical protein